MLVFLIMGFMAAVKPKSLVSEAFFSTLAAKVLQAEWQFVEASRKEEIEKAIGGLWDKLALGVFLHGVLLGIMIRSGAAFGLFSGPPQKKKMVKPVKEE